ncbi:MAG: hypothetical protein AAF318_01340 [Pseudomonadota bacterium]
MVRPGSETVLKILNGSQNGVEIELDDGAYTLGNGPDDDLQFIDLALSPGHAQLRLEGSALALKAGSGAVRTSTGLDLLPGDGAWRDIDQLDIVTIGTTRFAVGAATARWADLIAAANAADTTGAAPKPRFSGWPRAASLRRVALPVILLIGVFWIAASSMASRDAGLGLMGDAPRDDRAVIEETLGSFPFADHVAVDEAVDGNLYVRGHVDALVERRAIVNALRDAGVQPHVRLWVRQTIAREIETFIEARRLNIDYTLSNDGRVTLTGIVIDPAEADAFVALLNAQLLGVTEIVSSVRTGDTILAEVRTLAERSGLSGTVQFHRTGRLIEANGAVRNSALDGYVGFLQAYAKRFARLIPLRTRVGVEGLTLTIPDEALVLAAPQDDTGATGQRLNIDSLSGLGSEIRALFGTQRNTTDPQGDGVAAREDDNATPEGDGVAARQTTATPERLTRASTTPREDPRAPTQQVSAPSRDDDRSPRTKTLASRTENGAGNDAASREERPATLESRLAAPTSFSDAVRRFEGETADTAAAPWTAASSPQKVRLVGTGPHPKPLTGTALAMATSPVSSQRYRAAIVPEADAAPAPPPVAVVAQDAAPAVVPPEVRQAFARLSEATGALIDAFEDEKLPDLVGEDDAPDVAAAINDLDPSVRTIAARAAFLPADGREATGARACWPNARIAIEMLPQIIFWLDLLSVSQELRLANLSLENRGLLLEAALSPERLADCLARVGTPRAARMRQTSVYLRETARNEDFIAFIVRGVEAPDLDIVGANLSTRRYVQLVDGQKLAEGAAPDGASRIASIGEVGVLLRSVDGFLAAVYPGTLEWKIR